MSAVNQKKPGLLPGAEGGDEMIAQGVKSILAILRSVALNQIN
jgi:hypothetical protein